MKVIQIKGVSPALRLRLSAAAEANSRSVNQEALHRLERSFELEDALVSSTQQAWVDEALAGQMKAGSVKRLREIASKVRTSAI